MSPASGKKSERWPRSLFLQKEGTLGHVWVAAEPAGPSCQARGSQETGTPEQPLFTIVTQKH